MDHVRAPPSSLPPKFMLRLGLGHWIRASLTGRVDRQWPAVDPYGRDAEAEI